MRSIKPLLSLDCLLQFLAAYLCCASGARPLSCWNRHLRPPDRTTWSPCTSSPGLRVRISARDTGCRERTETWRAGSLVWTGRTPHGSLQMTENKIAKVIWMEKKKAKKRDDADLALSQGSVFVACEANMLHMYHMSAMFCQRQMMESWRPKPKGIIMEGWKMSNKTNLRLAETLQTSCHICGLRVRTPFSQLTLLSGPSQQWRQRGGLWGCPPWLWSLQISTHTVPW